MSCIIYILLITILLIKNCSFQEFETIDDIPIENYNPIEHQDGDMDLELLPQREAKLLVYNDDPKSYYFQLNDNLDTKFRSDLPRPLFPIDRMKTIQRKKRSSNSDLDNSLARDKERGSVLSRLVKNLGKPLEVVPLDIDNDKEETSTENLSINDFIRFRRSTSEEVTDSNKNITEDLQVDSHEKLHRQTRGISNDNWSKQLYPLKKDDEAIYEDNFTDNLRAPRVNFLTQKLVDNGLASTEIRSAGREARTKNLNEEKDLIGEGIRDKVFYEDRFRPYDPVMERMRPYSNREEMYRHDLRNARFIHNPRYDNFDRSARYYPNYQQRMAAAPPPLPPPKRIIYYTTLPEISRNPPNVYFRGRYRYDRDMYDDRYLNDPYRFEKGYSTARYEDESKIPYPVKVSTDVNVREVKKNPEKRIYSEVDRLGYAYNVSPYRPADG